MIDRLIASPEYVDHWTVKWGDLLQSSRKYLGEKGAYEFQHWIRDAIASNRPYDKLVRELLTARGSSYDNPAANYFRVTREAKPAMEKTTQVFLGVRMVCAQCHDHPFERWTQNQYYEMSAFFSAVGIRAGFEVGEEIVFDQRSDYEMKHPKDGRAMKPQFMLASRVTAVPDGPQRRDAFADWLTSRDNPFFARAIANRMWSYFVGKGIIDPVDDIRASNPPSNPALLEALTTNFVAHNFDLRDLMRTIVNSRTLSGVHRDQRVERHRPRQLLPCDSAASFRGRAHGCGILGGGRQAAIPRSSAGHGCFAVWWTRTSDERGFWTCSDVRRGILPASASGAPISASRRLSIW